MRSRSIAGANDQSPSMPSRHEGAATPGAVVRSEPRRRHVCPLPDGPRPARERPVDSAAAARDLVAHPGNPARHLRSVAGDVVLDRVLSRGRMGSDAARGLEAHLSFVQGPGPRQAARGSAGAAGRLGASGGGISMGSWRGTQLRGQRRRRAGSSFDNPRDRSRRGPGPPIHRARPFDATSHRPHSCPKRDSPTGFGAVGRVRRQVCEWDRVERHISSNISTTTVDRTRDTRILAVVLALVLAGGTGESGARTRHGPDAARHGPDAAGATRYNRPVTTCAPSTGSRAPRDSRRLATCAGDARAGDARADDASAGVLAATIRITAYAARARAAAVRHTDAGTRPSPTRWRPTPPCHLGGPPRGQPVVNRTGDPDRGLGTPARSARPGPLLVAGGTGQPA
jgi:hypothetical protein